MAAPHQHGVPIARRHATSVFTPALLFSLVVHAAIGGILFQHLRQVTVEPAPTLTVKLEVVPPAIIEAPAPPPPPKIQPPDPAPKSRAVAPPVPHVPAPTLIAVERVNTAPTNVAPPVAETPPAPVAVARAPALVAAPRV